MWAVKELSWEREGGIPPPLPLSPFPDAMNQLEAQWKRWRRCGAALRLSKLGQRLREYALNQSARYRGRPALIGPPSFRPPMLSLAAAGPCQKSIRQADRQLHRGAYAHTKDRQAEASGRRASGYNKVLAN